jgi:hypothetical protein
VCRRWDLSRAPGRGAPDGGGVARVTETVTLDPSLLDEAFGRALDADAASHAAAPPPPRVPWLNEDGSARWGHKADGTVRKAKPGTGRPPANGDGKPRTSDQPPPGPPPPPPPAPSASTAHDYSEDIGGALTMVWMGLATIPYTRAHAAIVRAQTPAMVPAWNVAAQQNPTVRKYVEKLSGEGSWAWVIPVTVVTMPLLTGMWQVTRNRELRVQLAAQTEKDFAAFIVEQARAAGMEIPETATTTEPPNGSSTPPQAAQETTAASPTGY